MNRNMTENEKKLLQTKHRLEEAEMRAVIRSEKRGHGG